LASLSGLLMAQAQAQASPFLKTLLRWWTDVGCSSPGRWCCGLGALFGPLWGPRYAGEQSARGAAKRNPWESARCERVARAQGCMWPAEAGGGVVPKRRRCSARATQRQVIHRWRV